MLGTEALGGRLLGRQPREPPEPCTRPLPCASSLGPPVLPAGKGGLRAVHNLVLDLETVCQIFIYLPFSSYYHSTVC